ACPSSLDPNHPAAVPAAVFSTPGGPVALALDDNFVDVYSEGDWSRVAAPGYTRAGCALFIGPNEGWLGGQAAIGRWSLAASTSPLVAWPQANKAPLTSLALPGGDNALTTRGALAVGLAGTAMHFEPGIGWVIDPLPPRASHIHLWGSPTRARRAP